MSDCLVHPRPSPLSFHMDHLATTLDTLKLTSVPPCSSHRVHDARHGNAPVGPREHYDDKLGTTQCFTQNVSLTDVNFPDPPIKNPAVRRLMFINNPYALNGPLIVSCDPVTPCPEGRAGAHPDRFGGTLQCHASIRRCFACEAPSASMPFPAGCPPHKPSPPPQVLLGSDCFASSPPASCHASDPNEGRAHSVIPLNLTPSPGCSEPSSLHSPKSSANHQDDPVTGEAESMRQSQVEFPSHCALAQLPISAHRSRPGKAFRPQPTMTLPACFTAASSLSSQSSLASRGLSLDVTDSSPPASTTGDGCPHPKPWKRLRAKRGFTFFACRECGAKWRIFQPGAWLGVAEPVS
eukprot:GGOE01061425.1.p1 GENE.GGOE01061425.1~~GGOE01061425.1.p1  ORF type:complete len:359 (+),score=34.84 GGOE01061425.1:27-1079(+)